MARRRVRVTFTIPKELAEEFDRTYAKLVLIGKKTPKSRIVEEAIREKLKEFKEELEKAQSGESVE